MAFFKGTSGFLTSNHSAQCQSHTDLPFNSYSSRLATPNSPFSRPDDTHSSTHALNTSSNYSSWSTANPTPGPTSSLCLAGRHSSTCDILSQINLLHPRKAYKIHYLILTLRPTYYQHLN